MATLKPFFLLIFAICLAVQPLLAHGHVHRASHGKAHELFHLQQHDRRNASSAAGNVTAGSAGDIIARFQQAMAAANQAILAAPKQNTPAVQNATTRRRQGLQAPPLDYSEDALRHANATVARRSALNSTAAGNQTSFDRQSYTVPAEVVEAARILAEANPLPPTDYQALLADVNVRTAKRKAHFNDTNAMPQTTQRPSGLVEYVRAEDLAITVQNGTQVAGPEQPDAGTDAGNDAGNARVSRRAATTFWMETITQRGTAPYAPADYKVWRNVKDYGAYGDGVHDDTAAINKAMSDGGRCGAGCPASTQFPATVYFPAGTYLVSSPIIQYYNTEMLGDPLNRPIILAAQSFAGLGVITSDVYVGDDVTWYLNQNNFLRSVRNFVMDIRPAPQDAYVCAIHWQVAQGTSLENIAFIATKPSEYDGTTHQGIYMENGSGGFMSDLVFVGGNFGAYFGNQQFTTSGLLFDSCRTGLQIHWDWGWTMQDTEFYNCEKGIVIVGGAGGPQSTGQGVGSLSLVDVHMWGVPVVVETSLFADNSTALHISNGGFENCATIVLDSQANQVLYPGDSAGITNVTSWGFGKVAGPTGETGFVNGAAMASPTYPDALLVADDIHPLPKFFHRTRPSYADPGSSQIFDVKALGARGDGTTDDTVVLQRILDVAANVSGIVYVPHGVYIITQTLDVPVGSRIIGQAWPQIMATGAHFQDMANPRAALRVGAVGSVGVMEIQCLMFTVRGPTAGAVLVEWNVHESAQGSAGLWDSHMRVGGAKGSNLQNADCPKTAADTSTSCIAASMLMHMTEKSSGYLENVWMWIADHDMEDADQVQISVYAARGILIESQGPTWLWGTAAEHAVLYQYQLSGAQNVVMGLIQTEAPYYQPTPAAPAPFADGLVFKDDPTFDTAVADADTDGMAWGLRVLDSTNVYVISAGLYTWFNDYDQDCVNNGANDCQLRAVYLEQSYDVWLYNLITIGAVEMVAPLNGNPVLAATNRNGYASSIVAWLGGANQTTGLRNITGYTLYTRDDLDSYSFSEQCKTALTATLACVDETMQWTSPAYHGSLDNATLQALVCDAGCGASLASWFHGVTASCADYTWSSGAPLPMAGGYVWYGYNESCLTETASKQYCNDVIDAFSESETLDAMPDSELCSECFTSRVRMMQQSAYSIYNTVPWYQKALAAIQTRCALALPSDVPAPFIAVPDPGSFCVSDTFYTIADGDTCDGIALAYNVSSANVFYAAAAAGATRGCSDLPAGLAICLPLACATYVLRSTDDCFSASVLAGVDDITRYNTWIDDGCDNLHEANATLGSVLCASPLGGTYVPGTATNTSVFPGSGIPVYSAAKADPPAGATVDNRTTPDCGKWYVAQPGDTCAYITSENTVGLDLFAGMNPSVNATSGTADGCTASIVAGQAYCVSVVFDPYGSAVNTPGNYTSLTSYGCWYNLDSASRILLGPVWNATELGRAVTLESCAADCYTDDYVLAGLRNNDTCLCGSEVSANSVRLSASVCDAAQAGNVSLYSLTESAPYYAYTDVGCFPNAALVTGSGPTTVTDDNAPNVCMALCLPAYPYFAVANGSSCICGTGLDATATQIDADANCNVACPGRTNANCGGAAAMYVYSSRKDPSPDAVLSSAIASSASATPTTL